MRHAFPPSARNWCDDSVSSERNRTRSFNTANAMTSMTAATPAIPPTAAPVLPITPGLPGISPGLCSCSGGVGGVLVLNFGSTVMLRSAAVSPLPGIEMRNGSQSYALLAFAESVRETRYRPSGRFWKVSWPAALVVPECWYSLFFAACAASFLAAS